MNETYNTLNSTIKTLQNSFDSLDEKVETINSSFNIELNALEQSLDQNISSLSSRINKIEGKTWHIADYEEIAGIAPLTLFSDNFQIKGTWIRIRWIAEASYVTLADFMESWLSVTIFYSDGTELTHRKTFVGTFSSMSTDIYIDPGEYYLKIDIGSAIAKILVVVWDYY